MISPCIDVIRKIAQVFQERLGSRQGAKHTDPDLSRDISSIMNSLHQHGVYQYKEGRSIDEDDNIIPDVISEGLSKLAAPSSSNPLKEYNASFRAAKQRREMVTVNELEGFASFLAAMSLDSQHESGEDEDRAETHVGVPAMRDTQAASAPDDEEPMLRDENDNYARHDLEETLPLVGEEDVELDMDGYDDFAEGIDNEEDWEDEEEFVLD
jgi:hypothetical protein